MYTLKMLHSWGMSTVRTWVSCFCLSVVLTLLTIGSAADPEPICSLIAATSIGYVSPEWQCDIQGQPLTDPCAWSGVSCPANSTNISSISLHEYGINGTIPLQIGGFSMLSNLDLSSNSLSSSLPSSLGALTRLSYLGLNTNFFSSSLPTEMGYLIKVSYLAIQHNAITGPLDPVYTMSSLTRLDAFGLELSGSLSSGIGSMTALQFMDMASSGIQGPLPSEIGLMASLRTVILSGNRITGTLPDSLDAVPLSLVMLSDNYLSGTLPSSLGRISSLTYLSIPNNDFSGKLPPTAFAGMTNLTFFDCYLNRFTGPLDALYQFGARIEYVQASDNFLDGTLSSAIATLSSLNELYLGNNLISGALPSALGEIQPLFWLSLSDNRLSVTIPQEIGSALKLFEFDIQHNCISGSLPSTMGNLSNLGYLLISNNAIAGSIPEEVYWNCTNLEGISASQNLFSGRVSNSIGNLKNLANYDASFNSLTSTIPSAIGLLPYLIYFNLESNAVSGSIPTTLCRVEVTGFEITVSNTYINCYDGCITSSPVEVVGASSECHDGSIMRRFLIIVGSVVGVIAILQISWYVVPKQANKLNELKWMPCIFGGIDCKKFVLCKKFSDSYSGKGKMFQIVKSLFSRRIVTISIGKMIFVLIAVLLIKIEWKYCGTSDPTEAVNGYSCTSNDLDSCSSFCDNVDTTVFTLFDPVFHTADEFGYCTAVFTESCACEYWKIFSLIPLMLHFVQFLLQCGCFFLFDDFNPQQVLYELILQNICGDVALRDLILPFSNPWYGLLPFIEVSTVVLVWLELPFSPTHCGSSVPSLSQYYYPMVMTVLDTWKLNIFFAARQFEREGFYAALLALFDFRVGFVHFLFCLYQSVVYLGSFVLMGIPFVRFHHNTVYNNNKLNAKMNNREASVDFCQASEGSGDKVQVSLQDTIAEVQSPMCEAKPEH